MMASGQSCGNWACDAAPNIGAQVAQGCPEGKLIFGFPVFTRSYP